MFSDLGDAIFSDAAKENFARSEIFRSAGITASMNRNGQGKRWPTFKFGVFVIMGHEHAARVATTNDSRERKLLEQISMAAHSVKIAAEQVQGVPKQEAEELIACINKWYAYIGQAADQEEMWRGVEEFVEDAPSDD